MDLDALITQFRLASREVFNHYFHRTTHDGDPLDASERFDEVDEGMFRAMVTWPAGLQEVPYREVQREIRVTSRNGRDVPCVVERAPGKWENDSMPAGAQLRFVRFFDWEELSLRDNTYVWVEAHEWSGRGTESVSVLIEAQYARFERVAL